MPRAYKYCTRSVSPADAVAGGTIALVLPVTAAGLMARVRYSERQVYLYARCPLCRAEHELSPAVLLTRSEAHRAGYKSWRKGSARGARGEVAGVTCPSGQPVSNLRCAAPNADVELLDLLCGYAS